MGMKEDYFAMMVSQFKRWDAQLGMLSEKGGQIGGAADDRYAEQLKTMRASRDDAYKKLQEIRTASQSAWRGMQTGVDAAWVSMKSALDKASSQSKK
jgi:hypothetical protein